MTLKWSSATDQLYAVSNSSPSLDLDFASNKSLLDNISGFPLVNHQRDASSGKSAGTYVGSDGLIKTSPVNLLTYSDYSQVVGTTTATLEGLAIAPDGTNTARRYSYSSGPAINKFVGVGIDGTDYTFSVYVRSTGVASQVILLVGNLAYSEIFNISTEWQRLDITKVNNSGTFVRAYVRIFNTGDEVEVWGAQVEEGSTVNTYIPTTNLPSGAPRFDHDPVTGESLGLLIEEARTNRLTYSSNHTQDTTHNFLAGYTTTVHTKVTNIDPPVEGDEVWIIENQGSSAYAIKSDGSTQSGYVSYTIFLKRYNSDTVNLASHFGNVVGTFNLVNGTITNGAYGVQMLPYPNGWYKIIWTRDYSSQSRQTGINIRPNSSTGVYVSGIQIEVGSFPTSIIPTSGSAVTRAADVADVTGTNFSSWYNQSEGTVFAEAIGSPQTTTTSNSTGGSGFPYIYSIDSSSSNRLIGARSAGVNNGSWCVFANPPGSFSYVTSSNFNTQQASYKVGGSYTSSTYVAFADGVIGSSITPGTDNSAMLRFRIGSGTDGGFWGGHISRLAYFPYRLSDTILQEITS